MPAPAAAESETARVAEAECGKPPRMLFQREEASRARRFIVAGVLLSAIGLAGVATFHLKGQRSPESKRKPAVARAIVDEILGVDEEQSVQPLFSIGEFWTKRAGTGCSNWRNIFMDDIIAKNAFVCGTECGNRSGCVGFSFQAHPCKSGQGAKHKNSCFLFAGVCNPEDNSCWDQYDLKVTKEKSWHLKKSATGCSDWHDVAFHRKTTLEENQDACGSRCDITDSCKAFNFKPGDCAEPDPENKFGSHSPTGTCMLYTSSNCSEMDNPCYDLYQMSN